MDRKTFERMFPTIATCVVDTQETISRNGRASPIVRRLGESFPEHNPCSQIRCREGGFHDDDFVAILRELVDTRKTERTDCIVCSGSESLGKGRSRSCENSLELKIRLTYKHVPANGR